MDKYLALLLCSGFLAGCGNELLTHDNQSDNKGYFADATQCSQSAMRKESLNVPTAGSVSVIEVPMGYDAGKFIVCMEYAKRPVSRGDAGEYLKVSTACLQEARGSEHPDNRYADCIKRSRLDIEIITDK